MSAFNWISDFGIKLLGIGQDLFELLVTTVKIPFLGSYTLLEIGFTALPIVIIPILIYKAIAS